MDRAMRLQNSSSVNVDMIMIIFGQISYTYVIFFYK